MAETCRECGCACKKCSSSESSHLLRADIAMLCKRLNESESRVEDLEAQLRKIRLSTAQKAEKSQQSTSSVLEQHRRLKTSYDEALQRNQELEDQVLKMGEEMQEERASFEAALRVVSEHLVDATENMNRMEKETVKNRKDCSLVVQLLKCNQSVNKDFLTEQVDTFPPELKKKLQGELDLQLPVQSIRKQRSKSSPASDQNGNAAKKPTNGKRLFMRRSKSTTSDSTNGHAPNGHVPNGVVDPPKKAVQAVYTGIGPGRNQPTKL